MHISVTLEQAKHGGFPCHAAPDVARYAAGAAYGAALANAKLPFEKQLSGMGNTTLQSLQYGQGGIHDRMGSAAGNIFGSLVGRR